MRQLFLLLFFCAPIFCFGQNEVGPDGYFLYLIIGFLIGVPVLIFIYTIGKKKVSFNLKGLFSKGRIEARLQGNKKYRPDLLTLIVRNKRSKDVDLNAPVLVIRKLWSVRKFRLKGTNRAEIYPLYLESNKKHELQLKLDVFHRHDPSLHSYYWARVVIKDTTGKTYATNYVTLRKSLIS
ncbi:hypothetical protein [Mangrovibacterium lignilyticum]|uniref:hypothetical protein n=1 Tax=Mangrovibacterium lignilyticum TaxID=2668052 RepID=UPI0013D2D7A7|nr:hypothetical protein [Mangrovibacterium lignilyticum]